MKQRKLAILVIQEAHLMDTHKDNIEVQYKRSKIYKSQSPNLRAAGVAIVFNQDIIPNQKIKEFKIIPGRAMLMTAQWHADLIISILNIYAPNTQPRMTYSGIKTRKPENSQTQCHAW